MIVFLMVDDLVEIHADQIANHGGTIEIRDMGLLESAAAMPTATFGGDFLHEGLYQMAAAYLFHLVKNHPFVDGNKRTALDAALTFLEMNGIQTEHWDDDRLYDATLDVVERRMDKAQLAVFFEQLAEAT